MSKDPGDAEAPVGGDEGTGFRERLARWTSQTSIAPTWCGLALAALGFVFLAYGWGRVAGLTNVALQVPYVVSAGFTGLGLIAVGCTLISVQARRQDAAGRDAGLSRLKSTLDDLEAREPESRAAPESSTGARRPARRDSRRSAPRTVAKR